MVLNGGRIEQIGSPLDVYRRPESMFVAAFIGSPAMNLFSVRQDQGTALIGETPIRLNADLNGTKEISLGLRPEDLFPVVAGSDGAMPLRVSYVEELGAQRLVHGHVADQQITATLASDHELADVLHVAARPASLHVFDPATGRRLN